MVVDGCTGGHFALASRSSRMIEVEYGCTMRLVPSTERDINGRVPGFRRSLVLAALLVASSVSMVALAPSRRDAVRRH